MNQRFFTPLTQLFLFLMLTVTMSCNLESSGFSKNGNTGMLTTYKNLKVGNTKMIMNEEEINHVDIPLGESFIIRNENVEGLKEKDGKVSVGCSLLIQDKDGKTLLSEPDLFKGEDLFAKEEAKFLSCTVNTGSPMQWEEAYNVTVVFTDKYGKGTIENKVKIRMIDVP